MAYYRNSPEARAEERGANLDKYPGGQTCYAFDDALENLG